MARAYSHVTLNEVSPLAYPNEPNLHSNNSYVMQF